MDKYLYELGLFEEKIGYQFLVDALNLLNNDIVLSLRICKVYDKIGEKYGKSRQYVERSLQNLFRTSFLKNRKTKDQLLYILKNLQKQNLI